jgi:ATP-dependent RNA helicase DOB1
MNSNLFSFLDDAHAENSEDHSHRLDTVDSGGEDLNKPGKRKAIPERPKSSRTDTSTGVNDGASPTPHKRLRISSPHPVVVDEFETEAKREVAASAGLTGGVESGSRLELKHQVCF